MDLEQYYLCKIAEEASELAQIALKTQQFGLFEKHPDLTINNLHRLYSELYDLLITLREFSEFVDKELQYTTPFLLPSNTIFKKRVEKMQKYLEYSQELGRVSNGNS